MPGEHIPNTLPIDDSLGLAWAPDLQRMWEALLGLLEGVEVPAVELPMEEEDEEEEWRERPPVAGEAGSS